MRRLNAGNGCFAELVNEGRHELVFNEGPNELFVIRVAGNSLGPDVLGSFRYAITHLRKSLRLLVVAGHSGCGALTAAVDAFLEPGGYLAIATNEQLRSIVDRHLIAVQASARALARAHGSDVIARPGYREALIETAITTNAALAAHMLQAELRGGGLRKVEGCIGSVHAGNAQTLDACRRLKRA